MVDPIESRRTTPDEDRRQPVSRYARRTISRRLKRVARLLPRAAKHPEKDVEYVHDLRVGVRRATAAIQLFAPLLNRSVRSEVDSHLRRTRRSAGPARDLDVIEERLSRLASAGGTTPQLAAAIDRVRRRRKKAQKPLVRAYKLVRKQDLKGRARDLSHRVKWRGDGPEPEVGEWAAIAIRPPIDRFVTRSSADLTDTRALHRMRIAEKHLRYSLEILEDALGPVAHDVAPFLTELQEQLGEINDHDAARVLLLRWRDRSKDDGLREVFAHLAAFEKWNGSYAHDKFLEWWTPAMRREIQERLGPIVGEASGQPELFIAATAG